MIFESVNTAPQYKEKIDIKKKKHGCHVSFTVVTSIGEMRYGYKPIMYLPLLT